MRDTSSRRELITCINCDTKNYATAEVCRNCGYDGWPFQRT